MHEMSYAYSLLQNVIRIAEERKAKKVKEIEIEVGELLLINIDQLIFCFKAISKDTLAENAEIHAVFSGPDMRCEKCGRRFDQIISICECGGKVCIKGGKSFIIKKISLEV